MTYPAAPVIELASQPFDLASIQPAQAGCGSALATIPEIRLQPGGLTHTGTLDIVFDPGSGAIDRQHNDLTLRPHQYFAGVARDQDIKSADRDEPIGWHGYKAVDDHA